MNIKCPKCNSTNIGTYRMPTGAIWCNDCNYRVEHKEIDKSFFIENDKEEIKFNLSKELEKINNYFNKISPEELLKELKDCGYKEEENDLL